MAGLDSKVCMAGLFSRVCPGGPKHSAVDTELQSGVTKYGEIWTVRGDRRRRDRPCSPY
jgi:hypothetical protein